MTCQRCLRPKKAGSSLCLEHFVEKRKAYDANRYASDEQRKMHKSYVLQRTYGLSYAEYEEILTYQRGVCAICRKPETAARRSTGTTMQLAVDHDHETGTVRGLLCTRCNRGIGNFSNDASRLTQAADYLARWNTARRTQV